MSIYQGAAWTPEVPDDGLAEDPAAAIAAAAERGEFDSFEPVEVCEGVLFVAGGEPRRCEDDDPHHYPATPHQVTITWYEDEDDALPPEPKCKACADVGIVGSDPCTAEGCHAGQVYADAVKASQAQPLAADPGASA